MKTREREDGGVDETRALRRTCALVSCLAALAVAIGACGSSSANGGDCAPAGTYVGVAMRSAAPGDCPADVQFPLQLNELQVTAGGACGVEMEQDTGSASSGAADGCSYSGTITLTASSTGILGKATFIVTGCSGSGASMCTANFALAYVQVQPTNAGGPASVVDSGAATTCTGNCDCTCSGGCLVTGLLGGACSCNEACSRSGCGSTGSGTCS